MKLSEEMRAWNTMEFYRVRKVVDKWADDVEQLEADKQNLMNAITDNGRLSLVHLEAWADAGGSETEMLLRRLVDCLLRDLEDNRA